MQYEECRVPVTAYLTFEVVVGLEAGSLASRRCSCEGELLGGGGGAVVGGGAYWIHEDASGDSGAGEVLLEAAELLPLWWFSVCLLRDLASQYDFPQPSALHS